MQEDKALNSAKRVGTGIAFIVLLKTRALPRWQGIAFPIGALLAGTPDGVETINLSTSVPLAAAFVPYGIQIIADRSGRSSR